jgi:hypothetical protein
VTKINEITASLLGIDSTQHLVLKLQQTLEALGHITIYMFDTILISEVNAIAFCIIAFKIVI